MYRIAKTFSFSASHQLDRLRGDHPCRWMHGHNYKVRAVFQSEELDERGFILDFNELAPLKEYIDSVFDHRHLNDVVDFHPTSENLAKHLLDWCKARWPQTIAVQVSETDKTWAEYSEG